MLPTLYKHRAASGSSKAITAATAMDRNDNTMMIADWTETDSNNTARGGVRSGHC